MLGTSTCSGTVEADKCLLYRQELAARCRLIWLRFRQVTVIAAASQLPHHCPACGAVHGGGYSKAIRRCLLLTQSGHREPFDILRRLGVWSWLASAAPNAVRSCVGVSEALLAVGLPPRHLPSRFCVVFGGDLMNELAIYAVLAAVMSLALLSLTAPALVLPF